MICSPIKTAISSIAIILATVSGNLSFAADLFEENAFQNYNANVENGKTLFNAGGCGSCHGTSDDVNLLSGGMKMESYVGTFYAPNISNSSKGISSWTNANFLNALIHGVSPKGKHYYPFFPYTNYAGMKPEDALDIKAYIASLPTSDNSVAEHKISFPYNTNTAISMWKRANFATPRYAPTDNSQLSRGKYLVETVGACSSCHTPRTTTFGIDNSQAYAGGIGLTGAVAPPLNPDILNGLKSPEVFTKGVLVDGKKLNGQPLADPVMRKITQQTAQLSDEDRLAMFAYLKGAKVEVKTVSLEKRSCAMSEESASTSTSDNSLATHADEFIGKYCRSCHGPGQSAVGSFPAGSLSSIAADASFVIPGDPNASRLMKSIRPPGRMPLGQQPTAAEVDKLGEWIAALDSPTAVKTAPSDQPPRGREMIRRKTMVQAALEDISHQPELDRPYIRYFSFRSEHNAIHPCETKRQFDKRLVLYKAGFNKMLNSVSSAPRLVVPEVVNGSRDLLVRVDIRDLGWDHYQWDVLINVYPYGVDPLSDPSLSALTKETQSVLPIIRSDWFTANSSIPAIYHALLDLPLHIKELEHRLGIDVERNIQKGDVVRAAFDRGASGVSAHNRMIERHDLPQRGYYWKSYDFADSFERQSLRDFPHGPPNVHLEFGLHPFEHDGGEMIFSLPNGMQAYYLSDAEGNRIDEGPEEIVSYQQRPKDKAPTIINGRSCVDCHADGILTKLDMMREHIQNTNIFDFDQQQFLLKMYVEQSQMDELYDRDRDQFVNSLHLINATEVSDNGIKRSIVAPGNKEIITWYADGYENNLNIDEFAAEFDLEPQAFKKAIRRISDLRVQQLATQKLLQLESGATIPRFEVEQQFAYLQEALTGLTPLTKAHVAEYNERYEKHSAKTDYTTQADKVHAEQAYKSGPAENAKSEQAYNEVIPQYQRHDYVSADKLELSLKTNSTDVRVGDKMSFTVQSNRDCEMQILYIESSGNVEVFPDQLVGDPWLRAGEPRHIPHEGAGAIEFDEAGHDESLIVFCSKNGLGHERLTTKSAKEIAKKSNKTASRGITFKLTKKIEEHAGKSAIHVVSYRVSR